MFVVVNIIILGYDVRLRRNPAEAGLLEELSADGRLHNAGFSGLLAWKFMCLIRLYYPHPVIKSVPGFW